MSPRLWCMQRCAIRPVRPQSWAHMRPDEVSRKKLDDESHAYQPDQVATLYMSWRAWAGQLGSTLPMIQPLRTLEYSTR